MISIEFFGLVFVCMAMALRCHWSMYMLWRDVCGSDTPFSVALVQHAKFVVSRIYILS
jgi:hypothetical protein